uniref:Uncharacterized protein n=1 Tax=Trypanosoma congolense (strain IL3000) TaxID=1068625 RepID=G0USC9_TRYCI|nr:conserved hypothetical protein [Trypanosoma congolense IL3000]
MATAATKEFDAQDLVKHEDSDKIPREVEAVDVDTIAAPPVEKQLPHQPVLPAHDVSDGFLGPREDERYVGQLSTSPLSRRSHLSPLSTQRSKRLGAGSSKNQATHGSRHPSWDGGNWLLGTESRMVGLGTTGLFEGKKQEENLPEGASAIINGQLVVAPPSCIRRLREYAAWRDRHRDFIAEFRAQDPLQRVNSHRRQQRRHEKKLKQQEEEYAAAVSRIRHRGKAVSKEPQPADAERQQWIKAQREILQAGREGVMIDNLKRGTALRETIAKELGVVKQVKLQKRADAQSAARQERDQQDVRREELQSLVLERSKIVKSDKEAWREYIKEVKIEEMKNRQQYLDQMRYRVMAKNAPTDYVGSSYPTLSSRTPNSAQRSNAERLTSDSSQVHPFQRPSLREAEARRQWLAELQQQRLEGARAAAEMIRSERSTSRRDEALRWNCDRAEVIRGERGALQERRQRQIKEQGIAHDVRREEHLLEKKQKDDAIQRMLEEKRENAASLRQAIVEEEARHHMHEEEVLDRMRERAAGVRHTFRKGTAGTSRGGTAQSQSSRTVEVPA